VEPGGLIFRDLKGLGDLGERKSFLVKIITSFLDVLVDLYPFTQSS
jgi:hypothetical protein